jgi:hypothetical protein
MKTKMILAGIAVIFAILGNITQAEEYYLMAYGQDKGISDRDVYLKRINLDSAMIVDSLLINSGGYISAKIPPRINVNNQTVLIPFVEVGCYCKNSKVGFNIIYYSIIGINGTLNLIRRDSIPDGLLLDLNQYSSNNYFQFSVVSNSSGAALYGLGNYSLNNQYNFIKVGELTPDPWSLSVSIGSNFKFLGRFNPSAAPNLCFAIGPDSRYWAIRINDTKTAVLDSVLLQRRIYASTIFAYHPSNNKLYCFYLNYENHGKFSDTEKSYGQNWRVPEVYIYDANTLQLLEQDTIADFTEGNYPGLEKNAADIVGNYIVYYFFQDEWMGRFYPAMLFIFDTRTNEARWLRVGWR